MPISNDILSRFPKLSRDDMERLLALPIGPSRMILDTDAANEIDDQFALTWALLSPDRIEMEGVTIEPFSFQHKRDDFLKTAEIMNGSGPKTEAEHDLVAKFGAWVEGHRKMGRDPKETVFVPPDEGMELSYREALTVYDKLGMDGTGAVKRGSEAFLTSPDAPLRTDSAEFIIERALAEPDRPLYVACIGCITNLASAMLIEPSIIRNLVVVWTSAFPSRVQLSNEPSLNLVEDPLASQLLFASGAAHVYLPGYHVGAQLRISLPEIERFVKGRGAIGDYLHYLYTHNPIHELRAVSDRERKTWVMWDIINIAWMINPAWVPSRLVPSPLLGDDLYWQEAADPHLMREAYGVDRDAMYEDFYDKLARA